MKRTDREERAFDFSPLLNAIKYLDEALKRGVVIGIFEGSMEVSDEDIVKGCTRVRTLLGQVADDVDLIAREINKSINKLTAAAGGTQH